MLKPLGYYSSILGKDRRKYYISILLLLVVNLHQLIPSYLLGAIVENLSSEVPNSTALSIMAILFGVLYMVASIIRLQTKKFMAGIRTRVNFAIRQESFRSLMYRADSDSEADSGAYVQTLNQGISAFNDLGNILQNEGVKTIVITSAVALLMAYYAWPLAILVFIYVLALYFQAQYFNRKLMSLETQRLQLQSQTSATIVDTIEGKRTLHAFKFSERIRDRAEGKNELLFSIDEEMRHLSFKLWQYFQSANGLFLALAIWQICHMAINKEITILLTVTLVGYIQSFVGSFSEILDTWSRLQASLVGLSRLALIYHPSSAVKTVGTSGRQVAAWETLDLKDIVYQYPNTSRPTIVNLSAQIRQGQHVIIKGPSGSGKTTLAKILVGAIKPQSGVIALDGAMLQTEDLPDFISFAMQEVQLFKMSLRDNITLCAEVPEASLQKIVKICRLEDLISRMPDGIDTTVGDAQWLLSGGELLRLSLSRALLLNPQILILDETTSMIEAKLELEILEDIRKTYPHLTLVMISHQSYERAWVKSEIRVVDE
jgi:ABC-type multidrug transport system fused ATPase/permease subunit